MTRPVVLGVVGDSGAGKTTLTRGLIRVLGEQHVARVNADDYHRYDRHERARLGLTPLNPACNHLDILTQHLLHLRRGEAVLKPVYDHRDGTLRAPCYLTPRRFLVVEGVLGFHTDTLRTAHDVRVFLAPPEGLRRAWKLKRDCTRRGYTTDAVLAELDRRERDVAAYLSPQRAHADIVVTFHGRDAEDPERLDADVILRDALSRVDLAPLLTGHAGDPTLERSGRDLVIHISGALAPARAQELEAALWSRVSLVSELRVQRLGEFTVGTDLHRSDSLALVQLLILFQLVSARAGSAVAVPTA